MLLLLWQEYYFFLQHSSILRKKMLEARRRGGWMSGLSIAAQWPYKLYCFINLLIIIYFCGFCCGWQWLRR
jgi:hypothetical protein